MSASPSPTEKYRALDPGRLRVGDVVLTGADGGTSLLIQRSTGGGPFSHAALYVGNGLVVESVPPAVRRLSVEAFNARVSGSRIHVFRPTSAVFDPARRPDQATRLNEEASFYGHSLYSLLKAIGIRFTPFRYPAASDALICSELVVQVYSSIGVTLLPGTTANSVSPNQLATSPVLRDVTRTCTRWVGKPSNPARFSDEVRSESTGWLRALLRSVSYSRRAWSLPHREWKTRHYLGAYQRQLFRLRAAALQLAVWRKMHRNLNARPHRLSDEVASTLRDRLTSDARKLSLEISIAGKLCAETYEEMNPAWARRFHAVERAQLAQCKLSLRVARDLLRLLALRASDGSVSPWPLR